MKLAAGEVAGEKSIKALAEVIDTLSQDTDITNRFGQKGLGQRNLGRAIQLLVESSETNEGRCMFAYDVFKAIERVILDYVNEPNDRAKYLSDLKVARGLYRERIMTEMFNAYMDEPQAIRKDVMNYVNMIIGIDAEQLGPDKMWKYKDPQTGELKALKVDERFIRSIEERLQLKTDEQRETFRTTIRKIYGQKISLDPNYDFMDNLELVKAVTDEQEEAFDMLPWVGPWQKSAALRRQDAPPLGLNARGLVSPIRPSSSCWPRTRNRAGKTSCWRRNGACFRPTPSDEVR
jgi:serine protein kinase